MLPGGIINEVYKKKDTKDRAPSTLYLIEDRELPPEPAMNFSLQTRRGDDLASGRCSVQEDDNKHKYLYISGIYVDGNTNYPTRKTPNQYAGLGQIMIYAAVKYGLELKLHSVCLVPVDGSEGFYIKMGFYPKTSTPNLSLNKNKITFSENKRINKKWINHFEEKTFLNPAFRQPDWYGNIQLIEGKLRENILQSWDIED